MGNQLVEVKDFPGFTVGDAIKIATHRLTEQGYRNIEPLPPLPRRAQDGLWRFLFPVAGPLSSLKGSQPRPHPPKQTPPPPLPSPPPAAGKVIRVRPERGGPPG